MIDLLKYCFCVWGIAIAAMLIYVGGMSVLILIGHIVAEVLGYDALPNRR